jgi:hypothetical protein
LYGFEIWSSRLKEVNKLRVFENKLWAKHSDLRDRKYREARSVKWKMVRCVKDVVRMGELNTAYTIVFAKSERKDLVRV